MSRAIEKPRVSAIVKKQIADLDRVFETAPRGEATSFGIKVSIVSLEKHRAQLIEELRAAEMLESESDMEIVFDGGPVKNHSIDMAFLESALKNINQLWRAMASELDYITENGPSGQLMVTTFVPSSFAIRVQVPPSLNERLPFDGEGRNIDYAMSDLFAGNIEPKKLERYFSNPNLRKAYKGFLSDVAKSGAIIGVRTKALPFVSKLDTGAIKKRIADIRQYEAVDVSGILAMGSLIKDEFIIKADTMTYSGKIEGQALEDIKQVPLGARIKSKILLPDGFNVSAVDDEKPRNISGSHLLHLELESASN